MQFSAAALLPVLAGPIVGSFLGVLIRRLPLGLPVAVARSACEACGRRLTPVELLPVVSFIAGRGRCRTCAAPIDRFHLAIELAAAGVPLSAWAAGLPAELVWTGSVLGWTLLALAWIDSVSWLLPDVLTLPLIPLGLLACWWFNPADLTEHALGAVLGYAGLNGVAWAYRRLRGRDGLGGGDAKLLAAGGAWVGALALPWVLLGAALAGLGVAVLSAGKVRLTARVPFGPPLALAIWVAWLHQ